MTADDIRRARLMGAMALASIPETPAHAQYLDLDTWRTWAAAHREDLSPNEIATLDGRG